MKTIFFYAMICIAFLFTACSSSNDAKPADVRTNLVDKYWCPETQGLTTYYFKSDGTYQQALPSDKTTLLSFGTWTLSGSTMKLIDKSGLGIDTDITFKNSTSTTVTLGTIFGDFAYKVCP